MDTFSKRVMGLGGDVNFDVSPPISPKESMLSWGDKAKQKIAAEKAKEKERIRKNKLYGLPKHRQNAGGHQSQIAKIRGSPSRETLTDSKGKALSGVPGPGTYVAPSSFGPSQVFKSSSVSSFGTRGRQQPFISNAHALNELGTQSPGPIYEAHSPDSSSLSVAFGSASRESNSVQFISKYHCQENLGRSTPGPGTYRRPRFTHSRGFTFSHSSAHRGNGHGQGGKKRNINDPRRVETPGPMTYHVPSYVGSGETPTYSFAPEGDFNKGKMRSRGNDEKATTGNTPRSMTPGPGAYSWRSSFEANATLHHVDSAVASKMDRAAAFSFGRSKKNNESGSQPFIDKYHVEADTTIPGPIYDMPNSIEQVTATSKFGKSKRFFEGDEGPLISKAHADYLYGVHSPGPKYKQKEGRGHQKTIGDAPTWKFSTSKRVPPGAESADTKQIPGPGAYMPRNAAESSGGNGMFRASPEHSLGLKQKSSWIGGGMDEPGPGAYEIRAVSADIRKANSPSWHFGACFDRSSFVQPSNVPGPGAYQPHAQAKTVQKTAPAYTFGTYDKKKSHKEQAKAVFISKMHQQSEKLGVLSPGPGAYKPYEPEWEGFQNKKGMFGTSSRESMYKQYCGAEYASSNGTPGPGTYHEKEGTRTKKKMRAANGGQTTGFSFGTSKRPPIASLRF